MSSSIYRHLITVPPTAIDQNGHLNNVVYIQWMQDIAIAHANHILQHLPPDPATTWIARSHTIDYLKPAYQDEQIALLTWCAGMRRVRAQRKYKFFRLSDNVLIAKGETTWVYANLKTGKPQSIPQATIDAFPIVSDDEAPNSP